MIEISARRSDAAASGSLQLRYAILIITLFWIGAIIVVNPSGNFPLNDDWSYALAVRNLVHRHVWLLTDFTSMPLGPQVLWGALFTLPFQDFSFVALRASTLVSACAATIGLYVLLFECVTDSSIALLGALAFAANPIAFALSFTFMTDVPFLALTIWALVMTVRYFKSTRPVDYGIALALLVGASLVRQAGIATAVGVALAVLVSRRSWPLALAPLLATVVALAGYQLWLSRTHLPALYSLQTHMLFQSLTDGPVSIALRFMRRSGQILTYVGLACFPLLVAFKNIRIGRDWLVYACLTGVLIASGYRMPFSGNVLNDLTLLPIIMSGAGERPHAPAWVWGAVTLIGIASAGSLLRLSFTHLRLWLQDRHRRLDPRVAMLAAAAVVSIAPFTLSALYDRYLLFAFAATIALICCANRGESRPKPLTLAAVIVAALTTISVALLHDTFSFNRARWSSVDAALVLGVEPESIDGGFEVNSWFAFQSPVTLTADGWLKRTNHPELIISLTPVDGYSVVQTERFQRWLPWERANMLLLRRTR